MKTVYNTALFEFEGMTPCSVAMRRDGSMVARCLGGIGMFPFPELMTKQLYASDIRTHNKKLSEMGLL